MQRDYEAPGAEVVFPEGFPYIRQPSIQQCICPGGWGQWAQQVSARVGGSIAHGAYTAQGVRNNYAGGAQGVARLCDERAAVRVCEVRSVSGGSGGSVLTRFARSPALAPA